MRPLPSPSALKSTLFPSLKAKCFIEESRRLSCHILSRKEKRKALIVGPCSIHNVSSALEYAERLKKLSYELAPTYFPVMRVYVEKSRTSKGWRGFLHDPDLDGSCHIEKGLHLTRELLIALAEKEVPCASEFVDPLAAPYFEDLLTWGFIGARTASSPPHRQLASVLSLPIGFKNRLDGEISCALNAMAAAEEEQTYLGLGEEGRLCALRSTGNSHTHLVLRGSCRGVNYESASVKEALHLLEEALLPPRVMVDCAHGNAQKSVEGQRVAFKNVVQQMQEEERSPFGLMLESHLEEGCQPLSPSAHPGLSVTDPCLGWEETEELLKSFRYTRGLLPHPNHIQKSLQAG